MPAADEPTVEAPAAAVGDDEDAPSTYLERVSAMFWAICEHWNFTHQHELDTSAITDELRDLRAEEAYQLGIALERAMLECIGTKRRRTYGHDTVYGVPYLYLLLKKPYLGATEGNEHAHQDMKKYFKKGTCKSSKAKTRAVQQTVDLMMLKQVTAGRMAKEVPLTTTTQMYLGLEPKRKKSEEGGFSRGVKSDDTICDAQAGLAAASGRADHRAAERAALDFTTQQKLKAKN